MAACQAGLQTRAGKGRLLGPPAPQGTEPVAISEPVCPWTSAGTHRPPPPGAASTQQAAPGLLFPPVTHLYAFVVVSPRLLRAPWEGPSL